MELLFRLKRDTFFRRYEDIGYLVNRMTSRDRVVNTVGAVFLGALTRTGRPFEEIVAEIAAQFIDAPDGLAQDILDFYAIMEQDGFIVRGETEAELEAADRSTGCWTRSVWRTRSLPGSPGPVRAPNR